MIKIDYKQFIRDHTWGGFDYELDLLDGVGEWGYRVQRDANRYWFSHKTRMDIVMWVIKRLNRWA